MTVSNNRYTKSERLQLRISPELRQLIELEILRSGYNRTISDIVRASLIEYLSRERK